MGAREERPREEAAAGCTGNHEMDQSEIGPQDAILPHYLLMAAYTAAPARTITRPGQVVEGR